MTALQNVPTIVMDVIWPLELVLIALLDSLIHQYALPALQTVQQKLVIVRLALVHLVKKAFMGMIALQPALRNVVLVIKLLAPVLLVLLVS